MSTNTIQESPIPSPGPKYDVAISFLSGDVQIALALEERLSPNFKVFVFPRAQEDIAGTDGLETFRAVFRHDSRMVVILYRDGWGNTNWTRVEEEAIKDRFFHEGWNWLLFVSLDAKSNPPKWYPDTRIRLDLEEYGLEQCVGAIRARGQELGAMVHHESPVERASRLQKARDWEAKRGLLLKSEEGFQAVRKEVESYWEVLEAMLGAIKAATDDFRVEYGRQEHYLVVTGKGASMTVGWSQSRPNSLLGARLRIGLWKGHKLLPGQQGFYFKDPKEYEAHVFLPDITREFGWCWRSEKEKYLTSRQLAEWAANAYLSAIEHAGEELV